jgi:hypothetical protein
MVEWLKFLKSDFLRVHINFLHIKLNIYFLIFYINSIQTNAHLGRVVEEAAFIYGWKLIP